MVFLLEECGEEREIDELHEVWRHEAGRWIVTCRRFRRFGDFWGAAAAIQLHFASALIVVVTKKIGRVTSVFCHS